jgi:hypothetical protein
MSLTSEVLGDVAAAGDTPRVHQRAALVTVTTHDGDKVTVSTWTTCPGVGQFVAHFLGKPSSRHTVHREPS